MPPSHDRNENDQNVHLGADRVNQDWHLNCNRSLPSQSSHKCICLRLFQIQKYPALGGYDCRWVGKGVIITEEQGSLSIWVASDVGQGWFLMRNRAMAIVEFVYQPWKSYDIVVSRSLSIPMANLHSSQVGRAEVPEMAKTATKAMADSFIVEELVEVVVVDKKTQLNWAGGSPYLGVSEIVQLNWETLLHHFTGEQTREYTKILRIMWSQIVSTAMKSHSLLLNLFH